VIVFTLIVEVVMSFSGKATYSAGAGLPEIAEDVSDLVAIHSPHETALLDALGDAVRPARSTVHEWLEDQLLGNTDAVADGSISNPLTETVFNIAAVTNFRVGDQIQLEGSAEVMLVTVVDAESTALTVVRGYGGTTAEALVTGTTIHILGNAALEGGDADAARFTARVRKTNYTQIFSATVEVSGSELAVRQLGVADELDYQKQHRTRELLRDLENSVINGRAPASGAEGSATVRRTMNGIVGLVQSNVFVPGTDGFAAGASLSEAQLNQALRSIWQSSSGQVDLVVVGGQEKRAINAFVGTNRRFTATGETYKDGVSVYESDYGVCRVVLSRWVPTGMVLLLDSSRIEVMPLAGRSFQYKPLVRTGDRESGQIVGEYTLELRNESAHGIIRGFTA
jgi:hypothetical protein